MGGAERAEKEREAERQKELALEKLRIQPGDIKFDFEKSSTTGIDDRAKLPKLPYFVDRKNNLESSLARFERFAEMSQWLDRSECIPDWTSSRLL
ncbi:hypothetical protein PoB_005406600 [Plakobranchus ocellatus]|uniref:Uncharacterized protein n=1 Tax=Plakobranchus ocellatus TaxID=259542 RepID=A0AAV4C482_9GAST|nr:hypothetical protein PoB_005406600 [Plakobranchus ocellatus]